MSFSRWLRNWKIGSAASTRPVRRFHRPELEQLEDRCLPAVFVVTTTADAGIGSLRQALLDSSNPLGPAGPHRIEFNLADNDPGHVYYRDDGIAGQTTLANITPTSVSDAELTDLDPDHPHSWWSIRPESELPGDHSFGAGFAIDGYSQPGATPNRQTTGFDAVLRIELRGDGLPDTGRAFPGLVLFANDSLVRGLVINRFAGPAIYNFGEGNRIAGNILGLGPDGLTVLPNAMGVHVGPFGSLVGSVIGGTDADDGNLDGVVESRNLISGNRDRGVFVDDDGVVIAGNLIGTDRTGALARGNGFGIVKNQNDTLVGGLEPGAGNLISGNLGAGVLSFFGSITIQGNLIGTDVTGARPLGNLGSGVVFYARGYVSGSVIGGDDPNGRAGNVISANQEGILLRERDATGLRVQGNRIFGNAGAGIRVNFDAQGNTFLSNAIHDNGGLGIDLSDNGVTPNDTGDGDGGANNHQNFPVLASATSSGGNTVIAASLNSLADTDFLIQFFASAAGDPSNFGEGARFLGQTTRRTDANGDFADSFALTGVTLEPGEVVSATATRLDAMGMPVETSEFSRFIPAQPGNQPPTADAGLDRTVQENVTVTFDGSSSGDPDNDTLTFSWDFGDGGAGSGVGPSHVYMDAGNYTVTLTVSDGTATASDTATVTVRVPPAPSVVQFTADEVSVAESQSTVTLTVIRSGNLDQSVTVRVRVAGGTATTGSLFSDVSFAGTEVTFVPGETSHTVSVAIFDDRVEEPDERLELELEIVPDPMTNAGIGPCHQFMLTIRNDDAPRMIPDVTEAYVRDLYQLFSVPGQAPRVPDEPGVANWVGHIQRGMPLIEVLRNFAQSPEGRITAIQQTYALLGRPVTAVELTAVQRFLALGGTVSQLRAIVLGFDEYYINRGGGSNTGFIQAAAVDLLGRTFSPSDLAFLGQVLARGLPRTTLARLILQAPEAINHALFFSAPGDFGQTSQASMAALAFERRDTLGTLSGLVGRGLQIRAQRIETYQLSLTPNQRWVNRIYEDLLGRYATIDEFYSVASRLDAAGGASAVREGLALELATSTEFRGLVVDRMFQFFLGRLPSTTQPGDPPVSLTDPNLGIDPTTPERALYIRLIEVGATFDRIRAELLSQPEFSVYEPPGARYEVYLQVALAWAAKADMKLQTNFFRTPLDPVLPNPVAVAFVIAVAREPAGRFGFGLGTVQFTRFNAVDSYLTQFLGPDSRSAPGYAPDDFVNEFVRAGILGHDTDPPREEQVIAHILGLDEYFQRVT